MTSHDEPPPPVQYATAELAAKRVKPNPWLVGLAASPFLVSLAALIGALFEPGALVALMHPTIIGITALSYVLIRKPWARVDARQVRVDQQGLRIGVDETVPHQDIKDAMVAPRTDGSARVRIRRRGLKLPVELDVASAAQGRWLLQGLGHDVSQRAAEFRTASLIRRKWWYALLVVVPAMVLSFALSAALAMVTPAIAPAGMLLMVLASLSMLIPCKVSVGTDSVLIRWLWHERAIDTADIAHVRTDTIRSGRSSSSAVFLLLADGEEVIVPVATNAWDAGRAAQLAQRIIDACQLRAASPQSTVAELRRNQRDMASWMLALRSLGQGSNATHRRGPVAHDQLWRVVEDAGASAADRAAAAVALRDQLDPQGRVRLANAARVTAAPKLRIALDAAADEVLAEEELMAALEQVESIDKH